jgi:hypothetical protein
MRYYQVNNQLYPSVTTVLGIIRKPRLETWRGEKGNEEADRLMKTAGSLGTVVHNMCEQINRGIPFDKLDIQSELVYRMVEAYWNWFTSTVEEIVACEKFVISSYGFAGTTDLVARLKGDKYPPVGDIKTSGDIYPDMALQTAAYRRACEEVGISAKRRMIIHLDKTNPGKWKIKEFPLSEYERDFRMFLYAKELWNYFEGGKPIDRRDIVAVCN